MTAIIDYDSGNIFSLGVALERIGEEYTITAEESIILAADRLILPGVGEASHAMNVILECKLDLIIPKTKVPVLGICIGMQLMCNNSEEGDTSCLGYFSPSVKRLAKERVKIPHMGWNSVNNLYGPLYEGIKEGEWFYFVHSFAPELSLLTTSVTEHGSLFSSSLASGRYFGTQFHPEKSGEAGERVLRNFINITRENL
ncbi:MAG: Imidazole glycerol phosphate synthase subunit hisH [uncultured bacterium]|nr:MAG: Imidazole glycerol phosphate synthase subunit hisH [uncultured bacterium]HBY02677.1 imidazole glycerol phosphate synthase subunit HisH [Rikenellaceae bacterium]